MSVVSVSSIPNSSLFTVHIQGVRLRRRNSTKLSKKNSKILFCSILLQILFNFLRPFGSKRLLRRRALPRKGHSVPPLPPPLSGERLRVGERSSGARPSGTLCFAKNVVGGGELTAAKQKILTPPPSPPLQGRGERREPPTGGGVGEKHFSLTKIFCVLGCTGDTTPINKGRTPCFGG